MQVRVLSPHQNVCLVCFRGCSIILASSFYLVIIFGLYRFYLYIGLYLKRLHYECKNEK